MASLISDSKVYECEIDTCMSINVLWVSYFLQYGPNISYVSYKLDFGIAVGSQLQTKSSRHRLIFKTNFTTCLLNACRALIEAHPMICGALAQLLFTLYKYQGSH